MSDGSGVSRGDRNRNARLARPRVLVPLSDAILRHLHTVITSGMAWDPVLATHGSQHKRANTKAA